jgi:hypothetical protein
MTYFLFQTALVTSIALFSGAIIGWWLHHYYGKQKRQTAHSDLSLVKNYLAESIRENSRLKLQLKSSEEKVNVLSTSHAPKIEGVDFEAYQTFENTVKEAKMRKYLN